MPYFSSRNIAAIALCASIWGILNSILAPIFFSIFHLPFLCDIIGFSVLILAAWWIKKPGAITLIGTIATLINFALAPNPIYFIGFTAASLFFDLTLTIIGYQKPFQTKTYTATSMITTSFVSAALAGYIIGTFFMNAPALTTAGGIFVWSGLHAIGGIIGGAIGVSLVTAINARKITIEHLTTNTPNSQTDTQQSNI